MEVDTSNDVVALDSPQVTTEPAEKKIEDPPIMKLFKRLLSNDQKENTVLTNAQIINLLEKEFNVDVNSLHELELDIYINIMKKYLKDWPMWDEFDSIFNNPKHKIEKKKLNETLLSKYAHLKNYLKCMLDIARPKAKEAVEAALIEIKNNTKKDSKDNKNVIMDVYCTRSQLNRLFYKTPHPETNTIFNIAEAGPSKINVTCPSLLALLNWWNVDIDINLGNLIIKRSSNHKLRHVLVNKKNSRDDSWTPMNTDYKWNNTYVSVNSKHEIWKVLESTVSGLSDPDFKSIASVIIHVIQRDFEMLPDTIIIGGTCERVGNKYPYVRYLYSEVEDAVDKKYDIQLREEICPFFEISVKKYESGMKQNLKAIADRFQVKCGLCSVTFVGLQLTDSLLQHFLETHMNEPNFNCTNCKKEFTMTLLGENWWKHDC